MDCGCNCFGIAASSKRPVKRYNLLVPEIFPKQCPALQPKLDASTEKKLKKLFEYLEKNPGRGPKISRRLARRVEKGIVAGQLGFVQIAVAAYIFLLERLKDVGSSLLAKEVICQQVAKPTHFYQNIVPATDCFAPRADSGMGSDLSSTNAGLGLTGSPEQSVIGKLLGSHESAIQTLGAQLLSAFIRQQVTAEYLAHVELLVEKMSSIQPRESIFGSQQLAILQAQQEYIKFCGRVSASCRLLNLLAANALALLSSSSKEALQSSLECQAAVNLLEIMAQNSQGLVQSQALLETILLSVDSSHGWNPDGSPADCLAIQILRNVCVDEQQQYLAYSVMIHYAATSKLPPLIRLSIASTACREGLRLPTIHTTSALLLAVRELCPWLAELGSESGSEAASIRADLLELIGQLAASIGDKQHLLDALGGIANKCARSSASPNPGLECMRIASRQLQPSLQKEGFTKSCMLPSVLLEELVFQILQGDAEGSSLACDSLCSILNSRIVALKSPQTLDILSCIFHRVQMRCRAEDFLALDQLFSALLLSSPKENLPEIAFLPEALQRRVLRNDEEESLDLPASQKLAVLLLVQSMFAQISELGHTANGELQLKLSSGSAELSMEGGKLHKTNNQSEFARNEDNWAQSRVQLQEEYQASTHDHPGSNELKPETHFVRLSDLLQRSRGHAASWLGGRLRTTDQEGKIPAARERGRVMLKPKTRVVLEAKEEDLQALLVEIGLAQAQTINRRQDQSAHSVEQKLPQGSAKTNGYNNAVPSEGKAIGAKCASEAAKSEVDQRPLNVTTWQQTEIMAD